MLLPDVNVLIYAHVEDATSDHHRYADWLVRMATGPEPFALSVLVLSGFLRIVTNARAFDPPSTLDTAFAFVSSLTERPTARVVGPGPDHMVILERLCRVAGATGKLVADAQHAAVALEHGCTVARGLDSRFGCLCAPVSSVPPHSALEAGTRRRPSALSPPPDRGSTGSGTRIRRR